MIVARAYLDYNATTPLRPEAREAMIEALDVVGNPSSIHGEGRAARAVVERARETVARAFGAKPSAVTFTSGGTETANWLLQPRDGGALVVSAVEHPCVLKGHRFAADRVRLVPVSGDGVVELAALEEAVSPGAVVAVQAANNETGVFQPVREIASLARAHGATLVCDAVQAIGRMHLSELEQSDAVFFSAHKFGGPKGVGAAIWRGCSEPPPAFVKGGGQERRLRSGTENVASIAGLAAALDAALRDQEMLIAKWGAFRSKLEQRLQAIAPEAVIFGERAVRLANTTCFAVPGKRADLMLMALDLDGVAVSSGSACSSGKVERSHVLTAMGAGEDLAAGAIRVSTGWATRDEDIERFLAALDKICGGREMRTAA
ncbi:cysteine desulfurase [Rhodomicrobium sp. Az07]|uniref:cysteine desulfurase family protein n=1 Tax=Rhodomicrobium sp. Az07 TaxID=2839034 RepID=UPI001BE5D229|nr:cysteine desulfurase family protein [Rhodomicrobium sp. Az07]MBT3070071.1 cysteine desulfurase [Rhodomicrobium sp. Az07]